MSSGKWRPSCLGLNELSHAVVWYVPIYAYALGMPHWHWCNLAYSVPEEYD